MEVHHVVGFNPLGVEVRRGSQGRRGAAQTDQSPARRCSEPAAEGVAGVGGGWKFDRAAVNVEARSGGVY